MNKERLQFFRWRLALPAMIVLLAFGLRVWAIGWGLPYADHPDEPAVSNVALGMLKRADWDPRTFVYPSLYYNLLRATFTAHWAVGKSRGLYADMAQLPATTDLYVTVPGFFVWGRLLTLALGVLTVGLALLVGRRWFGERAGLLGGLLLAVLPYHMRHSQYITTDVATGLTALLALGGALLVLDAGTWRRYALAGFAAGLAAGTKYNAGAVVLALIAAHGLHWGRGSLRQFGRLPWAALWSLIGFAATTPYAALHVDEFLRTGPTAVLAHYGSALHGDEIGRWPLGAYLAFFWREGLQPLPFLAALFGGWALWRQRHSEGARPALVLAAFVIPSTLLAMSQPMHFFRNLLPVLPPLCLIAGAGAAEASRLAGAWLGRRISGQERSATLAASALITLLVAGWPLLKAIELNRFQALPNSKVAAGAFIRDQLPRGMPVAVELNPVQWAGSPSVLPVASLARRDADWYRQRGIRYLAANEHARAKADQAGFELLRAQATVARAFPGNDEGHPGPHIDILDLGERLPALTPRPAQFGAALEFLGFQRGAGELRATLQPLDGAASLRAGQNLLLNLYWRVRQPLDRDYALFVHLKDASGATVAQRDAIVRQNDYPTSRWQPGELAMDMADLPLPAGLAPGAYQVQIGLYEMDTFARLPLSAPAGATGDGALSLMDVTIEP